MTSIKNHLVAFFGFILSGTFLIALIPNSSFASTIASVFVDNLSPKILTLQCDVFDGTSFYHSSNPSQIFEFSPFWTTTHTSLNSPANKPTNNPTNNPIDSPIDIKNSEGNTLNLHCHEEKNPENNFNYAAIDDVESVSTHGKFKYNRSYPGALIFRSSNI